MVIREIVGAWGAVQGAANRLLTGVLVMLAGLAGGCSTMTDVAGIPHAGHQSDGGYVLLASETKLDCRRLANEVEFGLKDMEASKTRIDAERDAMPTTLISVYGRMFDGPDGGLKSADSYRKSEQRIRALNGQLAEQGCQPVDVDARIMAFNLAPMNVAKTGSVAQSEPRQPLADLKADADRMTALSSMTHSR
jgi:hypothetical protein